MGSKTTELAPIDGVVALDVFPIVDTSAGSTKRISAENAFGYASADAAPFVSVQALSENVRAPRGYTVDIFEPVDLLSGQTYVFRSNIHVSKDARGHNAGAVKVGSSTSDLAGSALHALGRCVRNTDDTLITVDMLASYGGSFDQPWLNISYQDPLTQAGGLLIIEGTITAAADGEFILQATDNNIPNASFYNIIRAGSSLVVRQLT